MDNQLASKTKALFKNKARELQNTSGELIKPISPQRFLNIGWSGKQISTYYLLLHQCYHWVCGLTQIKISNDGKLKVDSAALQNPSKETTEIVDRIKENFHNFFIKTIETPLDFPQFEFELISYGAWHPFSRSPFFEPVEEVQYTDPVENVIKAHYSETDRDILDFIPWNFTFFSTLMEGKIGFQLLKKENPKEYESYLHVSNHKSTKKDLEKLFALVSNSDGHWDSFESLNCWAGHQQRNIICDAQEVFSRMKPNALSFEDEEEWDEALWSIQVGGGCLTNEASNIDGNPYSNFAEASKLFRLGYSVAKTSPLNTPQRQALLKDIIQSGEMEIIDIISHLNFLYSHSKNNPKYSDAREYWRADMLYLRDNF